jgi:hypothetical protein
MFFSYFPIKRTHEDPKKDLTIDGDSLWGTIYIYISKYVLQLVT